MFRTARLPAPPVIRPALALVLAVGGSLALAAGSAAPVQAGTGVQAASVPRPAAGKAAGGVLRGSGGGAAATAGKTVVVPFDSPGASRRQIKEVLVAVPDATKLLKMQVTRISYRGVACGFSFRGARPASPVTIRMSGQGARGGFDSGPLPIDWDATGDRDISAGSGTDENGKWTFVAEAHKNPTTAGWTVSVTGVSTEGEAGVPPTSAACELAASPVRPFAKANGPVGYWAGFATA